MVVCILFYQRGRTAFDVTEDCATAAALNEAMESVVMCRCSLKNAAGEDDGDEGC